MKNVIFFGVFGQKTGRAGQIILNLSTKRNQMFLKKLENKNFTWAAVLGANISQIFSPPFSSEKNLKIFGAWPWVFKCAIQLVPKLIIARIGLKL